MLSPQRSKGTKAGGGCDVASRSASLKDAHDVSQNFLYPNAVSERGSTYNNVGAYAVKDPCLVTQGNVPVPSTTKFKIARLQVQCTTCISHRFDAGFEHRGETAVGVARHIDLLAAAACFFRHLSEMHKYIKRFRGSLVRLVLEIVGLSAPS